jgi:hypothetical protein
MPQPDATIGAETESDGERDPLIGRFETVRAETERLAAPLGAEDQTVQSMPDASPTKWHRAHTTWFFETFILRPYDPGYEPLDPRYGYLFNSYYEQVGARHPRPQRGLVPRPGITEIAAYRALTGRPRRTQDQEAGEDWGGDNHGGGKRDNVSTAQRAFLQRARVTSAAREGDYSPEMEHAAAD